MKKIKVISCVLTVAHMALIFFFSAQTAEMSSRVSSDITYKIAELLCRLVQYADIEQMCEILHTFVRKTAHFTLFFILGIYVSNTICVLFNKYKKALFIQSAVFCMIYAITDEIHQIFVPGRACMLLDIAIDTAGAVCGIGLYLIIRKIYKRGHSNGM